MTVRKTCLKCGHTASVVLYGLATCPRCGALYAKTDEAHAEAQAAAGRAERRKLALLQLVAVAGLVLAGATWFAKSYLERQELRAAVDDVVRHGALISDGEAAAARRAALGEARILAERLKYRVTITASRRGSDAATIEVTNGSAVTLPYLTLETRRYLDGALVGAIRAPIVITGGIKPGQTRQFAYAPAGDMRPPHGRSHSRPRRRTAARRRAWPNCAARRAPRSSRRTARPSTSPRPRQPCSGSAASIRPASTCSWRKRPNRSPGPTARRSYAPWLPSQRAAMCC